MRQWLVHRVFTDTAYTECNESLCYGRAWYHDACQTRNFVADSSGKKLTPADFPIADTKGTKSKPVVARAT